MNPNAFISLKLGEKIIFQHPLSQLKQISSTIIKKNKQREYRNLDVIPKFIANKSMKEMNQDLSQRLISKKKIFDKINNTYFSKFHPDFSENLQNIENEMNNLQENIDKGTTNDYKKFGQMIYIINMNKTNGKIKSMSKMNIKDYKNINSEIKNDILNSISLNKKIFAQKIGLHKIDPNKLNQNLIKNKQNLTQYNTNFNKNNNLTNLENNKNEYNMTENNFNNNNNNVINSNNYNTEPNKKYNNNQRRAMPITDEQIDLFKTFVGNSKLSNIIISSYFDAFNPKVKQAAEKYFKSKYGSEFITLNFIYPTKPGNKIHKFKYTSEIKELFLAAQDDIISMNFPKLFLENGKEIYNNRKIKCIGALNLNNNSIIKVLRQ